MEFFAEDEPITIVPNFSLPAADRRHTLLLCGEHQGSLFQHLLLNCLDLTLYLQTEYGPFRPNTLLEVPLWLAIALHTRKKCRIQPPEWMDPDNLQRTAAQA